MAERKNIKAKIKKTYFFKVVKFLRNYIYDAHSLIALLLLTLHKSESRIKVAFICQETTNWNKVKSVYKKMEEDSRFETIILAFPKNCKQHGDSIQANEAYEYLIEKGYKRVINAKQGKKWITPNSVNADYYFFTRPYEQFMPKQWKTPNVCKYGKICLVLYATQLTFNLLPPTLNKAFMRNVYIFFAETKTEKKYNVNQNKIKHKLGIQKTIYCGIPAIETIINERDEHYSAWELINDKTNKRILWTPRWSTDSFGGGSNFTNYYKDFFDFINTNEGYSLLIRPHPLMLNSFEEQGVMTKEEIDSFLQLCMAHSCVSLDTEKEYSGTFWNTDILVSDYSSIIPEFLMTGKPIIYCDSEQVDWTFLPEFKKVIDTCYIAHCFNDIMLILEQLKAGIDPLKDKRNNCRMELYNEKDKPSSLIKDAILKDASAIK